MILEILILIIVLIFEGVTLIFPDLLIVFKIIGWLLLIFLAITILIDLFVNAPKFLSSKPPEIIQSGVDKWKRGYIKTMGISLMSRVLIIYLIILWFINK